MTTEIDWRGLLEKAVAAHKKGKAGVAARLGVSRALVSRVMSDGKSAIDPTRDFIDLVISRFHTVECPIGNFNLSTAISECEKANNPAPTHNPLAMNRWRECQRCPNRPTGDKQ